MTQRGSFFLDSLKHILDKTYTVETLKIIYPIYIYPLLKEDNIAVYGINVVNKMKKAELIIDFARVLIDERLLFKFINNLDDNVKTILTFLVWEGGEHSAESLKQRFGIDVLSVNRLGKNFYSSAVANQYLLFSIGHEYASGFGEYNYRYSLSLHDELRKLFKDYLPKPAHYDLKIIDALPNAEFIHQDNDAILNNLQVICLYIQQGNIKFSTPDKPLKASVALMAERCQITEFYPIKHKDLQYIKTNLILDLLLAFPLKDFDNPIKFIKDLFAHIFEHTQQGKKYLLFELLFHLKGLQHIRGGSYGQRQEEHERKVKKTLFKLLKSMSILKWLSVDNLIKHCKYQEINLAIVQQSIAERYLYFAQKYISKYMKDPGYRKTFVSSQIFSDVITAPFIKAMMFLLSSFGIVDIAYGLPENPDIQDKNKPYLSLFDGLKYIRLTSFGAYILGLTQSYDVTIKVEESNVQLDENRLVITLDKKDNVKSMVISQVGDKISDNCYKVSYQSFLRDCTSEDDISRKIENFKNHFPTLPPIWNDFFNDIISRINPLTENKDLFVYKLNENKELATLMAKDETLKKYILKAENYHVIIESKNFLKVKRRLEEFGYFLK